MKKIPKKFIDKLLEATEEICEIDCEECILDENNLCDKISSIFQKLEYIINNQEK